jgi:hypothetical protein
MCVLHKRKEVKQMRRRRKEDKDKEESSRERERRTSGRASTCRSPNAMITSTSTRAQADEQLKDNHMSFSSSKTST